MRDLHTSNCDLGRDGRSGRAFASLCGFSCVMPLKIWRGRCCNAIAFSFFFYRNAVFFCQIFRLSKLFECYTNFCKYEVLWPHEDYHIQQRGAYRVQLITLSVYLIV